MKILAMYLPQFHRIKENDEWWGEGYTEWTAVKNAKSLFINHKQPNVPLENNYYDLLDKEVMRHQAELMENYGIDGMCFYHYYFKEGRKVLEKPAENLLQWTDIQMPFCFSWANESWIRTWSNVKHGNSWSEIYEESGDSIDDKGMLLEQKYGTEEQWKQHFYYLLPFFRDKRYIKCDEHPVFIIYKPEDIYCFYDMKKCWNQLANEEGLGEIYFIGVNTVDILGNFDNIAVQNPVDTMQHCNIMNEADSIHGVNDYINYDEFWKGLLQRTYELKRKVCLGGVVRYDDTPRRGKKGLVLYGATPEKFQKYFSALLIRAAQLESDFVFLNAWNEWGEGMYLEPDTEWGYAYLEAVLEAKKDSSSDMGCLSLLKRTEQQYEEYLLESKEKEISIIQKENIRFKSYWTTLDRWIEIYLDGKSIGKQLKTLGYEKIAIYGLGMLGNHLLKELENNDIKVTYGIDQKEKGKQYKFPVYNLQNELPEIDLIIITVNHEYKFIKQELEKKVKAKIISIDLLLDEI